MRPDHLRVEPRARLRRPLLRLVVDVHDAEALRVAEAPLVVVEQRPGEVAPQVYTLTERRVRRAQVRAIIRDAQRIVDATFDRLRRVIERGTILGEVERDTPV